MTKAKAKELTLGEVRDFLIRQWAKASETEKAEFREAWGSELRPLFDALDNAVQLSRQD